MQRLVLVLIQNLETQLEPLELQHLLTKSSVQCTGATIPSSDTDFGTRCTTPCSDLLGLGLRAGWSFSGRSASNNTAAPPRQPWKRPRAELNETPICQHHHPLGGGVEDVRGPWRVKICCRK